MNISFHPAVVEEQPSFRYLTAIFWMFVDGRHRWIVQDDQVVLKSRWYQQESSYNQRQISSIAQKAGRSSSRKFDVEVISTGTPAVPGRTVNARDAEHYLRQPLLIVLENVHGDGLFLRQVLFRVAERKMKDKLKEAFALVEQEWGPLGDRRWFELRHGGGFTTARQVELAAEAAPALPLRVRVVVDSDRSQANANPTGTAGQVCEVCRRLSLPSFVLKKHEMENYLPEEFLRHHFGHRSDKWQNYTAADKDYGDLKSIFGDELWKKMLPSQGREPPGLHERAWRDRAGDNGEELDQLADYLLTAL